VRRFSTEDKLMTGTANDGEFQEFTSDPKSQFLSQDINQKLHQEYMTDDQRFAARRPDVLV
jgi:hypothetical protein